MEDESPVIADTPGRRFACVCGGSELSSPPPAEPNEDSQPPDGEGLGQVKPSGEDTDSDDGQGSSESSGRGVLRVMTSVGRLLLNPFAGRPAGRRGQGTVGQRRRRAPKAGAAWLNAAADNQALRRDTQLLIPGLCGLNNMGNTCFMNAAIQCLVHTPLLAAYMISGRYREDVNRTNRLGYGGAVAEEVARLMYQMWLGKYRSISPQSLKRCINATKPMFSGHEQQDSQEFLVELLDALHEDLNVNAGSAPTPSTDGDAPNPPSEDGRRKRTYSALGPSLEDEVATSLSTPELATYFWDRHRSRNSSVITRLVQGQLRSEVQCPVCKHCSRTFDPFSCISVPLPKDQAERAVPMVAFRRLPWLFKSTAEYCRMLSTGDISMDELVDSYVAMHRNRRTARRCTLTLSRLHEVRDLKTALARYLVGCAAQFNRSRQDGSDATGESSLGCHGQDDAGPISNKKLVLFEFKNKKLTKFLDDRSPLGVVDVVGPTQDPCGSGCYAYESGTDLEFVMSAPVEQFGRPYRSQEDDRSNGTMWESESSTALVRSEEGEAGLAERLTKLWFEPTDRVEYATHRSLSVHKTDVVVDLPDISSDPVMAAWRDDLTGKSYTAAAGLAAWPKDFISLLRLVRDCPPFSFRLDAFRAKQAWCSGSIVSCDLGNLYGAEYERPVGSGTAEPSMRIHFDGHSSLAEETFSERDFVKGRLAPLYSQTKRLLTLFEVRVTMRRVVDMGSAPHSKAASHHNKNGEAQKRKDLNHLPVSSAIDEILGRTRQPPNTPPGTVDPGAGGSAEQREQHSEAGGLQAPSTYVTHRSQTRVEPTPHGEVFVCQLESFKSCESAFRYIVEQVASRYLTDAELSDFIRAGLSQHTGDGDPWASQEVWGKLPFDIRLVTTSVGPAEVRHFEHGYGKDFASDGWENTLFPRDKARPLSNLYHNNFAVAVDWKSSRAGHRNSSRRGDSEAQIERQLEFLNDDGFEKLVSRHRSLVIQSAGAAPPSAGDVSGGVTLLDCLRAYSSDEVFDDGTWYCSPCKVHQPGVMRAWFYRLPDVLIIHIKRFNMTARWREKIRTKVMFPLEGLDMTEFMAEKMAAGDADKGPEEEAQGGPNNNVYDLYSVVNHMGGMGGGHYTAAVRYYGHPMEPSATSLKKNDADAQSSRTDNDTNTAAPAADGDTVLDPSVIDVTMSTDRTAGTSTGSAAAPREGSKPSKASKKEPKGKIKSRRSFSSLIKDALSCSRVSGVSLEKSMEMLDSLSSEQQAGMPSCVGQWYLLDDEACIPIPEEKVVSANAYVLFYRRRSLTVDHENGHMT